MKKTPTITKEKIAEYGSKLNQFILAQAWSDILPETTGFLQELADSLTAEDAEVALSEIDHNLEYDHNEFIFRFTTKHEGPKDDDPYSLLLEIGPSKKPYTITVTSRS